jgi:hypothetical protein
LLIRLLRGLKDKLISKKLLVIYIYQVRPFFNLVVASYNGYYSKKRFFFISFFGGMVDTVNSKFIL